MPPDAPAAAVAASDPDNASLLSGDAPDDAAAVAGKTNGKANGKAPANGAANGAVNAADDAADDAAADGELNPDGTPKNGETDNQEWFREFLNGLDKSEAMSFRNHASRYKAPNEFARAHIELHKQAVFLPKAEDRDADAKWDKVFERLGKPKEAKDYKFTDPKDLQLDDTDKDYRESFRSVAHRARLTQNQVEFLEGWQYENAKLMRDAQATATEEAPRKARNLLRSRWAGEFDRNVNDANLAFKHYAGSKASELAKTRLADGSYLADHPEFVAMMARVGKDRGEDDTVITDMNRSRAEDAKSEIEKITNEALGKGLDPTHRNWPHEQLDKLYRKAHGSRPIRQDGVS